MGGNITASGPTIGEYFKYPPNKTTQGNINLVETLILRLRNKGVKVVEVHGPTFKTFGQVYVVRSTDIKVELTSLNVPVPWDEIVNKILKMRKDIRDIIFAYELHLIRICDPTSFLEKVSFVFRHRMITEPATYSTIDASAELEIKEIDEMKRIEQGYTIDGRTYIKK